LSSGFNKIEQAHVGDGFPVLVKIHGLRGLLGFFKKLDSSGHMGWFEILGQKQNGPNQVNNNKSDIEFEFLALIFK
jgi:hypothetical protein